MSPPQYDTTARALALPVSPPRSLTTTHEPIRPPWTRRNNSTSSRGRSHSPYSRSPQSFQDSVIDNATKLIRRLNRFVARLTPFQRLLVFLGGAALSTTLILLIVYNEAIYRWLEPIAKKWKDLPAGWLILFVMTCITAFPPIIGYSTCVTLAGFVWGFPNGWFIVASATVIGSIGSFLISRTLLSRYTHALMDSDKRFLALATVLKSDGLKLLVMIRLCPLPYSLSNGALSTINTISPMTFALATALASPKLLIHVFMGSRFAEIAREGGHMDAGTKAINYLAIAFGGILGSTTGYLIYQRTMKRARELEAEERTKLNAPKITRRGPRAANGGLPSPSSFSDDPALAEREELLEDEEAQGADVIDFLENEDVGDEYADEFDDDHDLFHDEEEGIGLNEQRR